MSKIVEESKERHQIIIDKNQYLLHLQDKTRSKIKNPIERKPSFTNELLIFIFDPLVKYFKKGKFLLANVSSQQWTWIFPTTETI